MASHSEYFQTLQYLLDDGVSRQLEQKNRLRWVRRGDQWLPEIRSEWVPDETAIVVAAALGYHTRMTQEEVRPPVEMRVVHGNLEQVAHPGWWWGHYEGDSILSAEALLDKRLNGAMSELHRIRFVLRGQRACRTRVPESGAGNRGARYCGFGGVGKLTRGTDRQFYVGDDGLFPENPWRRWKRF